MSDRDPPGRREGDPPGRRDEDDPPRLREGDDDLARLLRQAHDDLPDDREMSRLAAHLSPPTPWPWAASPKLLGGLGVVAVLAGLAGLGGPALVARLSPPPAFPAQTGPQAAPAASPGEPAPRDLPADPGGAPPAASAPPGRPDMEAPVTPGPSVAGAVRRPAASRPPPEASAATPSLPAASTAAPAASAPPAVDPLLELSLLDQARRKSSSAPAEALALASEHARLFPRSSFGTEREVIVIESLQRAGRVDEARSRARRFLDASPRSAYRERLERLLR
jgi:hypothetical protein